jgi:hypothetical protein
MDDHEKTGLSFWDLDDPRTIVGQTRAVALMRSDKRASYKHFALLEFHWGWAHQKYNHTSLASVRKIHATLLERNPLGEAQISLPHINAANRDLVECGWLFELDKGIGRSASRFIPNYAIFKVAAEGNFRSFLEGDIDFSVYPLGEREGFGNSVNPLGNAGVTYEVNANRFCVDHAGNKDSLTETGRKDRSTEREIDPAPASPPLADGLEATAAGSAGEGFDELYRVYGNRQKKSEAKAAYMKLDPSPELHIHMVEAARRWHASWAAQGKADAPRFTLAKWIEREEYDCDPPAAFKAKERKAKAEPVVAETKPNKPDFTIYPDRPASGVIERAEKSTDEEDGTVMLEVWFRTSEGEDVEHMVICQSAISEEQEEGQRELRLLLDAVGLDDLSDPDDLIGRPAELMITHHGKFVSCSHPWVPAPAGPRNVPRFAEVINRTKPGGWALKIGQAYANDPEMDAA